MSEICLKPGEMRPVDFNQVSLAKVHAIGALSLADLTLIDRSNDFALEEQLKVEVFDSRQHDEENDDWQLTDIHQSYKNLLSDAGIEFSYFRSWLIHGRRSNITWHIDKAGDVRFLLNIGESTFVDIAEQWDPALYTPGRYGHPAPMKTKRLELATGDLYVCNNLVTNQSLLRPHETPPQENRIMLRTCFYPTDGWQNLANNGGLPIRLSQSLA